MDLVNAIVASKQQALGSQIQFAALRKVLDAEQESGAGAIELLNAATQNADKSVDTLAVAASGLGGNVDTYA